MENIDPDNRAQAALHIKGATIAWARGSVFDILKPAETDMTLREFAVSLAFTTRWRGQTFYDGKEVFYSVLEHCVRGAEHMLREGLPAAEALAFLGHEADEVPFGDWPGPAKQFWSDELRGIVKRCGMALCDRFDFGTGDPIVQKRWDIRMLVTEKRDLLPSHAAHVLSTNGEHMADDRYAAFDAPIIPYRDPLVVVDRFLALYATLRRRIGETAAVAA